MIRAPANGETLPHKLIYRQSASWQLKRKEVAWSHDVHMTGHRDLCGYYRILGVEPSVSSSDLKRAFKAKAQELHPDKNASEKATRDFQRLNEAYEILGDPQTRAEYDTECCAAAEETAEAPHRQIDPIVCSVCRKVSAQPRYVIFRHVISFIVVTQRNGHQGVFCSSCGAKQALKSSLLTWMLGWWGFPWGPIYSIQALVWNLFGGEQPAGSNFRLLGRQAAYFASIHRVDLAGALASQALLFWEKLKRSTSSSFPQADRDLADLCFHLRNTADRATPRLRTSWGVRSKFFIGQAGAAVFCLLLAIAIWQIRGMKKAYRHTPPATISEGEPVTTAANRLPVSRAQAFQEPILSLPKTGLMRSLQKYDRRTVLAPFKVVTAAGSPNYYVKVVDWATHAPVLVFFIRSGEVASVRMPLGKYEMRYVAGENWYGEEYLFGPDTQYQRAEDCLSFYTEGNKIAGYTIELIKQAEGNLKELDLSPEEF